MLKIDREKISALCENHRIKLLILHGSQAGGSATERSDIDIGILANDKLGLDRYRAILGDLGELFGDKFDPVFLNGAEPLITYQVAIGGKPLFAAKDSDFLDFKLQAIHRYQDTGKFRELEKAYVKRAAGRA